MPTSQEECPTCFTTPNCPTMGENHFLSLPHPMQRRGTAKDREIQHRAQKSSSSPPVRDWSLILRADVRAHLSAARRPSRRNSLWTISAGCAEVGAEREGARPASGTVPPAKHRASPEPSQAGSPAPPPGRPRSLGAGRRIGMGKGAGGRARNIFLGISEKRRQVREMIRERTTWQSPIACGSETEKERSWVRCFVGCCWFRGVLPYFIFHSQPPAISFSVTDFPPSPQRTPRDDSQPWLGATKTVTQTRGLSDNCLFL